MYITLNQLTIIAERISVRQPITQAGLDLTVLHMTNINMYIYIFVTPSRFRNVNESTMRMLASPRHALCSDNASAWRSDFWVEPNELVISTCNERHRLLAVLWEQNQTDGAKLIADSISVGGASKILLVQ